MRFKNPATAFMLFLMIYFIGINEIMAGIFMHSNAPRAVLSSLWFIIFIQLLNFIVPLFIWLAITKDTPEVLHGDGKSGFLSTLWNTFKKHMPSQSLGFTNIVLIFLISIFLLPAMMLISAISSLFVTNNAAELLMHFSAQPWWLMMLAIAVTPGIVEEVVFRGYIQSVTKAKNFATIAIFNGFLFGVMHLSAHQFMYTFLLGIVFAYMVHITRSIWAGIFSHFVLNGVNVTISHFAMRAYETAGESMAEQDLSAVYYMFAETDPDLALHLYEVVSNIRPEILIIIVAAVFAAIATPIAAVFFKVFASYNRERNEMIYPVEVKEEPAPFQVDWYLIVVVIIFLAIVALPLLPIETNYNMYYNITTCYM